MAKFVIKKGEHSHPDTNPQAAGVTSRFVIHKGDVTPALHSAGYAAYAGKSAFGTFPNIRDTLEGGRYRIDEIIGEGGSGRVCRAYDLLLEMNVAIKFLNPDLVRDEASINALKTETRICLQLVHKHIVRIYNLEKRGANFMLIMEYLKGETLFPLIMQFPKGMPLDFVTQIVSVVTDALGYAHRHGVIHKDVTPGNVFLTKDNVLKVIDFGISTKVATQRRTTDTVVGTPVYMSPEQLRGEILDYRTDIYSLGVLVHQLLTGRTPNAPDATIQQMAYRPCPAITGVPEPIADVLTTAMAFSPVDRWDSMEDFGAAFASAASAVQ